MAVSLNNPLSGALQPAGQLNRLYQQVSSGSRINSAADDAAGLVISTAMTSQLRGDQVALRNTADGLSYTSVASGALSQVSSNLQRMRELAVQSANGILSDSDRSALQAEVTQLTDSTRTLLRDSEFNGQKLFSGDNTLSFQTGADPADRITLSSSNLLASLEEGGLAQLSIRSPEGAASALGVLDSSLQQVSGRQAELGAVANRFEASINRTQSSMENTAAARSRISDADLARAISELTQGQIRSQAQIAVQAQANAQGSQLLRLLS